jgi:hypothetical protein
MEIGEATRPAIPNRDSPLQRKNPASAFASGVPIPHGCLVMGHLGLGQGEGPERDVPVVAGAEAFDYRLVGIASEWAQVVESDGESYGHAILPVGTLDDISPAGSWKACQ